MKTTGVGIIEQTLPDGRVHAFRYDKAERKAMGEEKFNELLNIWMDDVLEQEAKK